MINRILKSTTTSSSSSATQPLLSHLLKRNVEIKAVTLDSMNCLFTITGTTAYHYNKVLSKYGVSIDQNLLNKTFFRLFNDKLLQDPCFGYGNHHNHHHQHHLQQNNNNSNSNNSNIIHRNGERWWIDLIKDVLKVSIIPTGNGNQDNNQSESRQRIIDQIPQKAFTELYYRFAGTHYNNYVHRISQNNNQHLHPVHSNHTQTPQQQQQNECWELFPEVKYTLEELVQKKKILSIISNFDERLYSILDDLEIKDYFTNDHLLLNEKNKHQNLNPSSSTSSASSTAPPSKLIPRFITTSIDLGIQKPSLKIFEHSYHKLLQIEPNLKKEEILYIGDSLEKDHLPSLEYGFQSLLLDRNDKHKDQPLRISKLSDILPII